MSLAGNPPADLGRIDLPVGEMMFWMYLPISIPGTWEYKLPDNLQQFAPLIDKVFVNDPSNFYLRYVYLTAKTLWVEGGYIGNRPGWHIDGYGTNDVNFIWADREPTDFLIHGDGLYNLSDDCEESLRQMAKLGKFADTFDWSNLRTYPDRHLLRLDNTVIHRSPTGFAPGMRTFLKVSLSHDQYDLKGNSVNHLLPQTHWPLVDRQVIRNHPATKNADSAKALNR